MINDAERTAIEARRKYYGLDENREHAVGLAISGGGIRSATFSLGVLVALARRNLLPEFDYLSTVSGGGYLGSFPVHLHRVRLTLCTGVPRRS
jgi:predicted acylesterase/phospholipase RssA